MAFTCAGCRQPLGSDARFCPNCGAQVVAVQAAPPAPAPPAPAPPAIPAAPPGPPICTNCGIIAPTGHSFCSVCDATLNPQRSYAPGMPQGLAWAGLAVRFECRACGQLAPLNHLDVDGQIKCMHCGVEQRFDVTRWQSVIEQAQTAADPTGTIAKVQRVAAALGMGGSFEGLDKNAAFVTARVDALEVRVGPGHPLCEKCCFPLSIAGSTPSELTVVCPRCSSQHTYAIPPEAQGRFPALRGVVCAEQEVGRRDVQTEMGAGGSVVIRCGNCSAPLSLPEGKSVSNCTFCGVACRITPEAMWRTGTKSLRADWWWLLLAGAPPSQVQLESFHTQEVHARIRSQMAAQQGAQRKGNAGCVAGVALMGLLIGIGVAAFAVLRGNSGNGNAGSLLGVSRMIDNAGWNSVGAPLAYDINGDGVFDIVGEVRTVNPTDTIRLAVFDGKNGNSLWRSEVVGTYSDAGMSRLQIAGDSLLLPQEGGRLRSFKLTDGSPRFSIRLNENIERFCGSPQQGFVIVETKDKQHHTLALGDGGIRKAEPAGNCLPIEQPLPVPIVSGVFSQDAPIVRSQIDGMSSDKTIQLPGSTVLLALGEKRPGTRVPKLAAFRWPQAQDSAQQMAKLRSELATATAKEKSTLTRRINELRMHQVTGRYAGNPEVLWIADVPGVDLLSATEGSIDGNQVSIHGDFVVVVYGLKRSAHVYRLTALSLGSGKRLWDVGIDDDSPLSGVLATPHHVLLSRWGGLFVFDVKTGSLSYKIK
jgi:hypothetical protein